MTSEQEQPNLQSPAEQEARIAALQSALESIVAIDLKQDARGRDDFYSGPGCFFRAHTIAHEALRTFSLGQVWVSKVTNSEEPELGVMSLPAPPKEST